MMLVDGSETAVTQSQILTAEGLYKSYGPRTALQDLSFSVDPGEIMGLLGPNGAGKTTAIRILTTILEPSRGHFFIDGIGSEYPERIRCRIGVLPESLGLYKQMTGIECLTYFGQLYGRTRAEAKSYGLALLEEVGLQGRERSLIATYSRGMRQRLGIARALVNDPIVVFLDEPTLGLDPWGQQEIMSLARRIARERKAGVVWCSHILSEIESVCDTVVILSSGKVVARGSVRDVVGQAQRDRGYPSVIRVQVPLEALPDAHRILEAHPQVTSVKPGGTVAGWLEAELVTADSQAASENYRTKNSVLRALMDADIPILSVDSDGGRLQDVFLQLTAGAAR